MVDPKFKRQEGEKVLSLTICLVNTFYPPWRGGAETYTKNLASELARFGHNVSVVCEARPLSPGSAKEDSVTVNRIRSNVLPNSIPVGFELAETLLETDADVFHCGFPDPYSAYTTALVSRIRRLPAVLTWHNDFFSHSTLGKIVTEFHNQVLFPTYVRWYDRVISPSATYVSTSRTLSRVKGKTVVVPHGVDISRFRQGLSSPSSLAGIVHTKVPIILFVAALTKSHRYKGLPVLLRALVNVIESASEAILVVVGGGQLLSEYRTMAVSMGIQHNTVFAGEVPDSELGRYYCACDFLVLPSLDRSEGFGLVILEAAACGKPAIGSAVGGIPDAIADGVSGLLVPPGDPNALSNAILRLISDEELRTRLSAGALRVARESTWESAARKVESIYFDALAENGRSRAR